MSLQVSSELLELGLLDVVPAVSKLNDGINPHVELGEVGNLRLEVSAGLGVRVKISCLSEEVGSETFVRVVQDAVLVGVVEG